MAQQWEEGGWPLGLQPLNMRIGLARNREASSSMSFSTFITDTSSSSSVSSSDLDTQSTGSFFPEKSTTLGNLIGIRSIIEVSGRRRRRGEEASPDELKRLSCGGCRGGHGFLSLAAPNLLVVPMPAAAAPTTLSPHSPTS